MLLAALTPLGVTVPPGDAPDTTKPISPPVSWLEKPKKQFARKKKELSGCFGVNENSKELLEATDKGIEKNTPEKQLRFFNNITMFNAQFTNNRIFNKKFWTK